MFVAMRPLRIIPLLVAAQLAGCQHQDRVGTTGEGIGQRKAEHRLQYDGGQPTGLAGDSVKNRERRHPRLPDNDVSGVGFYEPNIDINLATTNRGVMLRFRAREATGETYTPTVKSIELWKKGEKQMTCEMRSAGIAIKEWTFGDVPDGFENVRCVQLTSGDYEINVRGLGGSGRLRMNIDGKGRATAQPWYGQSTLPWDGK
jgi:hypothetical protein